MFQRGTLGTNDLTDYSDVRVAGCHHGHPRAQGYIFFVDPCTHDDACWKGVTSRQGFQGKSQGPPRRRHTPIYCAVRSCRTYEIYDVWTVSIQRIAVRQKLL